MLLQVKNKLIFIVSLLLISGFLATSLTSYYVSRSSLRSQISQTELPLTSDNIYSEIQRDLLRPIFISSLMANDTFLRDWMIQGESDVVQIKRYLSEILKKYNAFTTFLVSENTRTYYHSTGILKQVIEHEPRDAWYFRVREMKQEYEINVDPDLANKDSMTIFINYRVFDYENRFIGATGIGLKVSAVKDLIKKYQASYGRNIYFVDKQGIIKLDGSGRVDGAKNIRSLEGLANLSDDILTDNEDHFSYQQDGNTYHLNTRYIPEFEWYLLVEQAEDAAARKIMNTLMVNLSICTVITCVVLILTNMTISSYQKKLEKMATTDKLTGIANRQAFDVFFNQIINDSIRQNKPFSLILFDIDLFKNVNDRYGHLAGDDVLKKIVALTKDEIRGSDILCRWGGEEFLILLKECSVEDAYMISEKVRLAVSREIFIYNQTEIRTTISLGVTQYKSTEQEDDLLSRVDTLLYQAKEKGRNITEKG